MPYDEFLLWQQYLRLQPIGWREDDRTLKLLQVQGFKGAPESVFNSFAIIKNANQELSTKVPLEGSMMLNFMKGAIGGDSLFGAKNA